MVGPGAALTGEEATVLGRGLAVAIRGGTGAPEVVEGGASSTGSPIEIVDGTAAGGGASVSVTVTTGALAAADAGAFGSSVDTAITAAAVRSTTTPPTSASPMRTPMLAFVGGGGIDAMLRIGPRLMSRGV